MDSFLFLLLPQSFFARHEEEPLTCLLVTDNLHYTCAIYSILHCTELTISLQRALSTVELAATGCGRDKVRVPRPGPGRGRRSKRGSSEFDHQRLIRRDSEPFLLSSHINPPPLHSPRFSPNTDCINASSSSSQSPAREDFGDALGDIPARRPGPGRVRGRRQG